MRLIILAIWALILVQSADAHHGRGAAAGAVSGPVANILASRTSGPTPLAVFFDATGTTEAGLDSWRQVGYQFNFADSGAGNWTYNGQNSNASKNLQTGAPVAAHVFETAGTYTVVVTAKDFSGNSSTASVTITVTDANTFYSGTNTVCLSTNTDFTGCPSGATQTGSISAWPAWANSTRYLLHNGQDFTGLGGLNYQGSSTSISDGQISAFGTGAKPLVGDISVDRNPNPPAGWGHRDVIANLQFTSLIENVGNTDFLVFNNTSTGWIQYAAAFSYYVTNDLMNAYPNPTNIFIVQNSINEGYSANNYGITGNAIGFALYGNMVDETYFHNVRIWQASKLSVAHNYFTGNIASTQYHAMKLQAGEYDPIYYPTLPIGNSQPDGEGGNTQLTSYWSFSDNNFGSTNSNINWLTSPGAENDTSPEGLEQGIIEDSSFTHNTTNGDWAADTAWYGNNLTDRGNLDVTTSSAITITSGHGAALPPGWNGPYYTSQTSVLTLFP